MPRGSLCSHDSGEHAVWEGQRDEEPALRTSRQRIRHVRVETSEASLQAWGVQLLQTLDLRQQKSSSAPLEGDSLCDVPRGDVSLFRHLGKRLDQSFLADHESGAYTGSNELRERAHVDRTVRREFEECRLLTAPIPK